MRPIIKVDALSKQYRLGTQKEPYSTLRESIAGTFRLPFEFFRRNGHSERNAIWALKDVTFDVKPGEIVGLIGKNGAGKSTLLKILSRITEPTEGYAEVFGRVGSLLEVGTGFHPELTGRENIFLNGAILGMQRSDIRRRFDEIVAFAELEKFIDTPVKYFSSGMYVRLAFAVAAHLEPAILIIDEVLAVGDANFQRKCLGKMSDTVREGRTVLFVSHQLNQIRRLCSKAIWIDHGRISKSGSTEAVVAAYESSMSSSAICSARGSLHDQSMGPARFLSWDIIQPVQPNSHFLTSAGAFVVQFKVQLSQPIQSGCNGIALRDNNGQVVWAWRGENLQLSSGSIALEYQFPHLPLRPGVYHWQVSLYDGATLLDNWYGVPEMVIATIPVSNLTDEWCGLLNIACELNIRYPKRVTN